MRIEMNRFGRVKFPIFCLISMYFRHETSRQQLYLQLRRDILEKRCLCEEDQVMTLAGLALQAEYGDYIKESMGRNYFIPEHYFPEHAVKRLGSGYIRQHAADAHKTYTGMTEVEAKMEFIKVSIEYYLSHYIQLECVITSFIYFP